MHERTHALSLERTRARTIYSGIPQLTPKALLLMAQVRVMHGNNAVINFDDAIMLPDEETVWPEKDDGRRNFSGMDFGGLASCA